MEGVSPSVSSAVAAHWRSVPVRTPVAGVTAAAAEKAGGVFTMSVVAEAETLAPAAVLATLAGAAPIPLAVKTVPTVGDEDENQDEAEHVMGVVTATDGREEHEFDLSQPAACIARLTALLDRAAFRQNSRLARKLGMMNRSLSTSLSSATFSSSSCDLSVDPVCRIAPRWRLILQPINIRTLQVRLYPQSR